MLPAEITSTAAKPRMILARNLRVGIIVRFDDDAIRPDIPTPIFIQPRSGGAPPLTWLRKTKAESIRGGKFGGPAEFRLYQPSELKRRTAQGYRGWHPSCAPAPHPIWPTRPPPTNVGHSGSMTFP